jgi:hypothetical protein
LDNDNGKDNEGGYRVSKHAKVWAKDAFDEWWKFRNYDTKKSIANYYENENIIM